VDKPVHDSGKSTLSQCEHFISPPVMKKASTTMTGTKALLTVKVLAWITPTSQWKSEPTPLEHRNKRH
jgi:hypothetical protein